MCTSVSMSVFVVVSPSGVVIVWCCAIPVENEAGRREGQEHAKSAPSPSLLSSAHPLRAHVRTYLESIRWRTATWLYRLHSSVRVRLIDRRLLSLVRLPVPWRSRWKLAITSLFSATFESLRFHGRRALPHSQKKVKKKRTKQTECGQTGRQRGRQLTLVSTEQEEDGTNRREREGEKGMGDGVERTYRMPHGGSHFVDTRTLETVFCALP